MSRPFDPAALQNRLRQIDRRLGELRAVLDKPSERFTRTATMALGSVLAFGGIILTPPTGGASAFFTGAGLLLWANEVRKDAEIVNRSKAAAFEMRQLLDEAREIEKELRWHGVPRRRP